MDEDIRTSHGLTSKINSIQGHLIKRFGAIVDAAAINKTDRNSSATLQYQMQVDTAALIRTTEELQALIHSLQEMWLFGQLKTINKDTNQAQTDETAREIEKLLEQLTDRWSNETKPETDAMETEG